ncbi:putative glycosidase CRH2 [Ceratocystis pirilliformis]|uniref:Crh-like protein n=1 Tax=Ceratocystis pirilliformis TaxID=259994 RepID=A0ABR3YHL6_9PEZI
MYRSTLLGVAAALLWQSSPSSAADQVECSLETKCPESAPCCSQYGACGTGAFCLGGCDPRMSFSLDSCVPGPVCESKTYKWDDPDRIVSTSKYLGDPSKADWVYQGNPMEHNGNILLTMPKNSVGTVMATSAYMWYGNVKAKFKTSRGAGVVTAFILMSDVKDEIDYEFIGVDLSTAQTNYYFQGIPDYNNGGNMSDISNTFDEFHEYEIRWTPDQIDWLVDGRVGRSKKRADTWNATAQQWDFPQTPARVQLSLWPGGLATNGKGTIDWAGGEIDWNGEDIQKHGYYYATFSEVTVECYDAPTAPGSNKKTSYYYSDISATNNTVVDSDKKTILSSFIATGTNMTAGAKKETDSDDESNDSNQVPGGSNVPVTVPGEDSSSSDPGSSSSLGSSSGSSSSSGSLGGTGCGKSGFSQDCDSSNAATISSSATTSAAAASSVALLRGSLGLCILWVGALCAV